jgi:hypothetical protein
VRLVVERPTGRFHTLDSLSPCFRNGPENKRATNASPPVVRLDGNLVDLAPGSRPSEGILWETLKHGQDVAYGLTLFLGDPDSSGWFLEKRFVPLG